MSIAIYTLTSELHDENAVSVVTKEFIDNISEGFDFDMRYSDWSDYGSHEMDLIYVRTGGTEGIFRKNLDIIRSKGGKAPILLLTSGKSNSLAAAMEILSFMRQNGLKGEIIHGEPRYIRKRITDLQATVKAIKKLDGSRLGIIGKPSDWLISSNAEHQAVREKLGVELVDIPIDELKSAVEATSDEFAPMIQLADAKQCVKDAYPGAMKIYYGLRSIIAQHDLNGLTIRCFDLLNSIHNTSCLALAKLNAEGIIAGCEGDVPAMLTMAICNALFGISGFQANPSSINPETGEYLFAHCTIPLDMVTRYSFDTHFESGIGIGIRGHFNEGPVTVFKVSGDLSRYVAFEGSLLRNQSKPDLCRTQVVLNLPSEAADYFLKNPIGNHHIIIPGHCKAILGSLLG